jgi:DNA modification methylase
MGLYRQGDPPVRRSIQSRVPGTGSAFRGRAINMSTRVKQSLRKLPRGSARNARRVTHAGELGQPGRLRDLQLESQPIAHLKPHQGNARTHSRKQIRQIAESIRRFGFTNPVLIDDAGGIIAGHGRVEAAKLLGFAEVPTIRVTQLTDAEKRAYIIADNRLAENAGWDRDLLALELDYIRALDVDFDLTITGLDTPQIDMLMDGVEANSAADAIPERDPSRPVIARPGDLWRLGPHRLLCADARDGGSYRCLLGVQRAQLVFTDPPYNVVVRGHVSGLGKVQHREFIMASGELSRPEFANFLGAALRNLAAHSADGSIHFICMDWRHIDELLAAAQPVYSELKNICVWVKDNGGMGSLYRSRHELVFVFKNGTAPHVNNVELGRHGRYRSNVWSYPGVNSFRTGRDAELQMHPTVKPVALVADAIKDCSKHNAIILDPFVGSGTTIIAAEQTGRRAYAMELDPEHVDTALRRWELYAGEPAVHDATGQPFGRDTAAPARPGGRVP